MSFAPLSAMPFAVSPTPVTSLGVFHTKRGGQVNLFSSGLQKYDYSEILRSSAYQALSVGQSLVDTFIIHFPDTGQKFLYMVTITRTQNFNQPAVINRKFHILQETPIGGIVYRTREGRLGYYAGDVINSPIYQELAPGKKIFETFCLNPQHCHIVVEITKPTESTGKPFIKFIREKK